jgi:hypothetical protein
MIMDKALKEAQVDLLLCLDVWGNRGIAPTFLGGQLHAADALPPGKMSLGGWMGPVERAVFILP